eukprot:1162143-Pelagomonas_calceolata.AAC.33
MARMRVGVVVGVVGADGVGMHIDAAFAKGAVKAAVDVLPGAQTAQESKAMVGSGNAGEGQSAILEASRAGAPVCHRGMVEMGLRWVRARTWEGMGRKAT